MQHHQRRHQHDAVTAYRGAGRPEATAAAERAMDCSPPSRHGPCRGAPQQPHSQVPRTAHHGDRADVRRRRLRGCTRQGARRLPTTRRSAPSRPAARDAAPSNSASVSASTSRSPAAWTRSASTPRSRCSTTVTPSCTPARRRTARVMSPPGACWRPSRPASRWTGSTWCGATPIWFRGFRHDGFAVAAAGRRGRVDSSRGAGRQGPQARSEVARGRRSRHRARQGQRRVPCRRHAGVAQVWAELSSPRSRQRPAGTGSQAAPFFQAPARRSPSVPTSQSSRSTSRPVGPHLRHVACDDAGTVLNPLLLEGQIHGGIAQGTAQALFEEVRYDADGNPITSNLADYAFISAAELPSFEVVHMETPTHREPARRQGHRRERHDRLHTGGAIGRHRRRQPSRCAAHRHAVHGQRVLERHRGSTNIAFRTGQGTDEIATSYDHSSAWMGIGGCAAGASPAPSPPVPDDSGR